MAAARNVFQSIFSTLKLVTVEPYVFFCLFGYTVRLVTFQSLLMDSACRNLHMFSDEICKSIDNHKYQQAASMEAGNNLYACMMLLSNLPAVVVAAFLGPWSDKYSRKYPMIIAACGIMLETITSAVLTSFPNISPLWYLVGSIFSGFSGEFVICISASFSYISDITDERSRATRYAVLEFAAILATVLGQVLGGEIFKRGGYLPVMITAPCSLGMAILYTVFRLKETKVRTPDQTFTVMIRDLFTVDNIKGSYETCSVKRPGNIRLQIWLLLWVNFSYRFVEMGVIAISFPFAKLMYKWDVTEFSQVITAFYVLTAFVAIAIVPILSSKLRLHEAAIGLIGMISLTAKMVVMSVAFQEHLFYFAWISGAFNSTCGIAIRSRLSKLVNKNELGRAFSLMGTCESVTPLLGTLVFIQMYNASVLEYPGLPFAVTAVFLIPSVFIFSWTMKLPSISLGEYARNENTEENPMENFSSNYAPLDEEKI